MPFHLRFGACSIFPVKKLPFGAPIPIPIVWAKKVEISDDFFSY